MKHIASCTALSLAVTLVATACSAQVQNSAPSPSQAKISWMDNWIQRPWEMRYVIVGMHGGWDTAQRTAKTNNTNSKDVYPGGYEELFELTASIRWPNPVLRSDPIEVLVIEFDEQGLVKTPGRHTGTLRGRLAERRESPLVVLSEGDGPTNRQHHLGYWFLGLGDRSTDWAPTICGDNEHPSRFSATDISYKYGPKFVIDDQATTFGCREWAYQLYDDARPYIDVTSYVPKSKLRPHGGYIREFIGWARFGDKKPVIGRHETTWMCLHDCPNGDKPGVIPDINAWAARNGWAPPKPPKKMPMFPDPTRNRATTD